MSPDKKIRFFKCPYMLLIDYYCLQSISRFIAPEMGVMKYEKQCC